MKRRIEGVCLTGTEALQIVEKLQRMGRRNVSAHHEKIRAESTWRWGWVIVADEERKG